MRKSFLVSGVLLASFLALRCDGGNQGDDDDGDSGESGESGKGGRASGGKPSTAGKGSSGSSATTGGSSGRGSGGDAASGGTGDTGSGATGGTGGGTGGTGTGGGGTTGDAGMAGEPGTGGTNGGTGGGGNGGKGGSAGMSAGGSSGAGASGGAGGTSGKGGSAGTGGSSGKGGAGGTGGMSCGTGEGLALVVEPGETVGTGWIEGDNNCVGIQGAILLQKDPGGSTITLDSADGHICVHGTAVQVVGGDFESYWGAMVVIQLNNPGTGYAYPYNANTYGVDGFSFTLSAGDGAGGIPAEVRTELMTSSATQYCKRICDDGAQSVLISQAHADCWEGDTGSTPSATALELVQFMIPASEVEDTDFSFCIDDLAAITNGVSLGDPGVCPEPPVSDPDSCVGYCGTLSPNCYCDAFCIDYPEAGCCEDFAAACL